MILLGLGQGKTYIASETSAFSRYTKNYIALKDGEIGVVRAKDTTLGTIHPRTTSPTHNFLHTLLYILSHLLAHTLSHLLTNF